MIAQQPDGYADFFQDQWCKKSGASGKGKAERVLTAENSTCAGPTPSPVRRPRCLAARCLPEMTKGVTALARFAAAEVNHGRRVVAIRAVVTARATACVVAAVGAAEIHNIARRGTRASHNYRRGGNIDHWLLVNDGNWISRRLRGGLSLRLIHDRSRRRGTACDHHWFLRRETEHRGNGQ